MSYDELLAMWKMCREARKYGMFLTANNPVRFIEDSDFAYMVEDSENQYWVFDGSDNFREWVENFIVIPFGKAFSHLGFDNASRGFFHKMIERANRHKKQWFFGHSRGGAICQGVALRFAEMGMVGHCVTFGSPKMGGRVFSRRMSKYSIQHTRVEMHGDIVCDVPLTRKHYETEHVVLEHSLEGIERVHLGYGVGLQEAINGITNR